MNTHHQEILEEIKKAAERKTIDPRFDPQRYSGHNDPVYPVNNPTMRQIAKSWLREHKDLSFEELLATLDSLYRGSSDNEKRIAGMIIGYLRPTVRQKISLEKLDEWLNFLVGWCQIDSLCQSGFDVDDLLANWAEWKQFIRHLARSENINKRRAALVFLVRSVRSGNKEIVDFAFKIIDQLKLERDKLITKAISWLLREIIRGGRSKKVENYLSENEASLPTVALRETRKKLLTGKKN